MTKESLTFSTLSKGQFIGARIASILPGFGIGHAIQGRYGESGWIATAGGVMMAIGGLWLGSSLVPHPSSAENREVSISGAVVVMTVGLGIRVWEMIDVWKIPYDYKAVKAKTLQFYPLVFYDQKSKNLDWGLSLSYRF